MHLSNSTLLDEPRGLAAGLGERNSASPTRCAIVARVRRLRSPQ